MEWEIILTGIQTVSVLLAALVAAGTIKRRHSEDVAELAVMKKDIEYIKSRVDDISGMRERLTAVESSAQQAHLRIDRLEGRCAREK
jgi:hypothetical protein